MSFRITYVTESHTFEDDKASAEILDTSDVRRIASEQAARVGKENKGDMERLSKHTDKTLSDLRESVSRAKAVAEESQRSIDKLVGNVRDAFASSVVEILRPQYETFARILEAATSPTAPEKEFHIQALQTLENVGNVVRELQANTDKRLAASDEALAQVRKDLGNIRESIAELHKLCDRISSDIQNSPEKKGFFRRLFSRHP